MTIVKVSKKKIIKAIETEPLRPGNWIDRPYTYVFNDNIDKVLAPKDCPVCAVGSVLRHILSENTSILLFEKAARYSMNKGDFIGNWKFELEAEKYMAALSSFFEGICITYRYPRKSMGKIRARLVRFVEDNFPDHVEINIDGAKPAKDVKVVG